MQPPLQLAVLQGRRPTFFPPRRIRSTISAPETAPPKCMRRGPGRAPGPLSPGSHVAHTIPSPAGPPPPAPEAGPRRPLPVRRPEAGMLSGSGRPDCEVQPPPPAAPAPRPPPRRRRPSSAPALARAGPQGPDRGGSEVAAQRARLGKASHSRLRASPAR